MKVIKKIFKFLFGLLLIVILAGSGYVMYDYVQHPEKYEDFAQMFEDKLTGRDKIVIKEVSPFVKPTFELVNQKNAADHVWSYHTAFETSEEVIFTYYKSLGGELYLPAQHGQEQKQALICSGVDGSLTDITEHMQMDEKSAVMIIKEAALKDQPAGEYIIIAGTKGNDASWKRYCVVIEEEVTYNNPQCECANQGDVEHFYLYNNIDDPQEISFYFYNTGDNPIVALLEVRSNIHDEVDKKQYTINEQGNKVTLNAEYLDEHLINTSVEYAVRLANGEEKKMNYVKMWNVNEKGLDHLVLQGPSVYSLSKGGDFVLTYDLGGCTNVWGFYLYRWDETATEIFTAKKIQDLTSPYVDLENHVITVPEEVMQTLEPDNYGCWVGYFMNDYWADSNKVNFTVVE